ncbi:MAG: hypothetical protein ACTS4W_01790 [Candidatus Hodgkinia cicadicola]
MLKWETIPWLKWHSQWRECKGLKGWCCSLLTNMRGERWESQWQGASKLGA